MTTVPRVLHRAITPGRVYPLYGVHYSIHRGVARMTNVKPLTKLFGDSSYIVALPELARIPADARSSRRGRTSAPG